MTFQWYGQSFFRIDTKNAVIAIDPFSKIADQGFVKIPRFRADITLVSHEHADHNNVDAIDGTPAILRGAGEYEIKGVFVKGIRSFHDESAGKERGDNTIFVLEAEDLRVCHMGDVGTKKLPEYVLEEIDDIDVLMVPIGGTYTVDARGAWNIVQQIEPKIVIPMHYKIPGIKLPLDGPEKFLKEAGVNPEAEDKLSIRKKELPDEGIKIHRLRPLAFIT